MIHICLNIDDSLLFCEATDLECQKVLNILDSYGECSSQQINKSKTTIFFSKIHFEWAKGMYQNCVGSSGDQVIWEVFGFAFFDWEKEQS